MQQQPFHVYRLIMWGTPPQTPSNAWTVLQVARYYQSHTLCYTFHDAKERSFKVETEEFDKTIVQQWVSSRAEEIAQLGVGDEIHDAPTDDDKVLLASYLKERPKVVRS